MCFSQLGPSLLWPRDRSEWVQIPALFSELSQNHCFFFLCVSVSRKTDLLLLLILGLGKAALGLQLIPSNQLQCIRQIWSITALSLCTWANKSTLLQNKSGGGTRNAGLVMDLCSDSQYLQQQGGNRLTQRGCEDAAVRPVLASSSSPKFVSSPTSLFS